MKQSVRVRFKFPWNLKKFLRVDYILKEVIKWGGRFSDPDIDRVFLPLCCGFPFFSCYQHLYS